MTVKGAALPQYPHSRGPISYGTGTGYSTSCSTLLWVERVLGCCNCHDSSAASSDTTSSDCSIPLGVWCAASVEQSVHDFNGGHLMAGSVMQLCCTCFQHHSTNTFPIFHT